MSDDRLHIVFGTGQVGIALAAHLAGLGIAVRAVSRHRPPALAGVDWRAADAADPQAAADAAKGASVIYRCLNAPYTQWPERFPPLQRGGVLWLDHVVHIPRYRVIGLTLTVGPVVLVVTMSGSSLAVTTGIATGVVLLATAAGFHDLAAIRAARLPGPASLGAEG